MSKRRPSLAVLWSGASPVAPVAAKPSSLAPARETLLVDASAFMWAHFQSTGVTSPQDMVRDMGLWSSRQLELDENIRFGAWVLDSLGASARKREMLNQPSSPPRRQYSSITTTSQPPLEYKEGERKRLPNVIRDTNQFLRSLDVCGRLRLVAHPQTEADDVIASLVAQHTPHFSSHTTICSPDKDFLQLISPQVQVRAAFHNAADTTMTLKKFLARFKGLTPDQYCDYVGLVGGDPLLPRVDPKRAIALLREHRDLTGVFQHAKLPINHREAAWDKAACLLDAKLKLQPPRGTPSWQDALALV